MTPQEYVNLSDWQLVALFNSSQDIYALYVLVCDRYGDKIKKTFGAVCTGGYDTEDLNDMLTEFYHHMAQPTKSTGTSRLANFNPENDFGAYICSSARNYIMDRQKADQEKKSREVEADNPESPASQLMADDDKDAIEFKRMQYLSLLLSLEGIEKASSTRDQYIWLTHVLNSSVVANNPHEESVYPQLAEQLGINQATVKQASKRVKDKVAKDAKKFLTELVTGSSDLSIGNED